MTILGSLAIEGMFKPSPHYGNAFSNMLGGLEIKKSVKELLKSYEKEGYAC